MPGSSPRLRRIAAGIALTASIPVAVAETSQPLPDPFTGGTPTEIRYVGTGTGCDHATIQSAVDAAASGAEIRVVGGSGYGAVNIGDVGSLAIRGGYDDCSATASTGQSILDGGGSATVMDVFTFQNPVTLELENLTLQNGAGVSLAGGLQIEGPAHSVLLRDVRILNNAANESSGDDTTGHGAGIRIKSTAGAQVFLVDTSQVSNNTAAGDGGGIYCDATGGTPALVVFGDGAIQGNLADHGGGVHASNCEFVSRAGGFLQGIYNNEARFTGGGIFATAGSTVGLLGDAPGIYVDGNPEAPANLISNTAGGFGGGAYLDEDGTTMVSIDGVISNNSAGNAGGGVFVDFQAAFEMRRDNGTDCVSFDTALSPPPCSRLENNSAAGEGGAVGASGATVDISQTFISGNSTDADGAVLRLSATDSVFEGNVIHDHSDASLFLVENSSDFTLGWSTVAGNTPGAGNPIIRAKAGSGDNTQLFLYSSIIRQSSGDILGQEPSDGGMINVETADCLITHELASIPGDTRSQVADPLFMNPAADDYHIGAGSPAIDYCDDTNSPTRPDMDAQIRGVDEIAGGFRWDVGADELHDALFSDRFES